MTITANLVKELREKTGVGMMDCKKALQETQGDFEAAIKFLREKGLAAASKKADRVANEGRTAIAVSGQDAVIVEINCETDFVGNNDAFIAFGDQIAQFLIQNRSVKTMDELETQTIEGKGFKEFTSEAVLKMGENIQVKQFKRLNAAHIASYIHMNGKIGVVVGFSGPVNEDLGKDIAMHVAAINPAYLLSSEVPSGELDKEIEIIRNQAANEGRPANVIDNIVKGKVQKFYQENCLEEQGFVKDPKQQIKNILPAGSKITGFVRLALAQ